MFLHEWYKFWHNRKLLGFLVALLLVNALYFWYHAERDVAPAHAYRALTADLRGYSDAEAAEQLAQMKQDASAIYYMEPGNVVWTDPKYTDSLFTERELLAIKEAEYNDVLDYPKFVKKAAGTAAEYKMLLTILGGSGDKMKDVEKTSKEYEQLLGLTIRQTHTKGIAEALSLPSLIFLELLLAVLLTSLMFTKEKEQGLLRLYSSMKSGRGRMFLTRVGAISVGCAVCNFLFLLTTLLTGCLLYGRPIGSFLTEPVQSLIGYKQTVMQINIGTFLLLVFVWSCIVSTAVVLLTSVVSSLVSSALKVYVILFSLIGIEGILYMKIDDLSYLAGFKRINLVSFADPGYTIARYHNEIVFGDPISYPLVALALLALLILVCAAVGWILSNKGFGVIPRRGRGLRFLRIFKRSEEHGFGSHTRLSLHESVKFFRFEKIGYILLILAVFLLATTKPYKKYDSSIEEMFYQSYLYRVEQVGPEQYGDIIVQFKEEMEREQRMSSDSSSLQYKQTALNRITEYLTYLQSKEGSQALDVRGYEKLYKDRKQNVILGVCAVLAAILCGAASMAVEYRTGMIGQIRISPKRGKVFLCKALILLGTVTLFYGMIYGRYLYQVLKGYGTYGIGFSANSLPDWKNLPASFSMAGGIALVWLKRYVGMLLVTSVTVFATSRIKSFLMTAIVCLVIIAVPLLLCLWESGVLSYIMFNYFFVI